MRSLADVDVVAREIVSASGELRMTNIATPTSYGIHTNTDIVFRRPDLEDEGARKVDKNIQEDAKCRW